MEYFLPPKNAIAISTDSVQHLVEDGLYLPITVAKNDAYSTAISTTERYLDEDDVISEGILEALYIEGDKPHQTHEYFCLNILRRFRVGSYLSATGKVYEYGHCIQIPGGPLQNLISQMVMTLTMCSWRAYLAGRM